MEYTTVGRMIQSLRVEKNTITRKKLACGLCSEQTLFGIETEQCESDVLLLDILIQRLGKSPDKFEMILNADMYNMVRLRDLLESSILRGKREIAERILRNYPSRTNIDQMYRHRMGYFDQYEGNVLYDTVESRTVNSDSLYHYISYVPQKGILLNATVRDNFKLFDERTDDKTLMEKISQVGLKQRLDEFEHALDHVLSNTEEELSGGEKQRLSLGRALLAKKNILFLDEATSALDHESYLDVEKVILESAIPTIISVQHRLEKKVMENYDMIIAMRNGEIVEHGNWEQLIAKKGYFYTLVQAQAVNERKG